MGDRLGIVRLYSIDSGGNRSFERSGFLYPSSATRRIRGRLLPGHHLLSNLVVSRGLPRAGHQLLYAGDSNLVDRGGADLRTVAQRVWLGTGRLAMAIHSRSVAIDSGGLLRVVLSNRFSAPGPLAAEGRNRVAGERASDR